MPDTITLTPRVVPGAPPPAPASKAPKKKRKGGKTKEESEGGTHVVIPDTTTAVLIEKAPEESDIKEGIVAPQLVAQPSEDAQTPVSDHKPSHIVDMLSKRLKANNKKINRIQIYQNESPDKLNEDQKRLLKTLPVLEAVSKELEEVRKAIETHEVELAQELALQKAEVARVEAERRREAVAAAEREHLEKAAELVSFLRLHSLLVKSHPEALALNLNESESNAIYSITEILLHEIVRGKEETIRGIYTGEGEHLGVPFSRIIDIQQQFLFDPPQQPAPVEVDHEEPVVEESAPPVSGISHTLTTPGGIHFIMTDELAETEAEAEAEAVGQADNSEWVDVQAAAEAEQPAEVEIIETVVEAQINGHTVVEESVTVTTTTEEIPASGQLSWADEDHGELPSLANLQAHYGTSGEASPVPEAGTLLPEAPLPDAPSTPNVNGQSIVDEEGFTQLRGRGRGRGIRGGERGGYRGGHRGEHGERGGFRGGYRGEHGERGGYRGEHGERGGYRGEHGERGGHRGEHGERSGHRGEHGERGGFRGEHGERGGRGGFRGGRGTDRGGFRGRADGDWRGGRGGRGRGRGFTDGRNPAPSPAA